MNELLSLPELRTLELGGVGLTDNDLKILKSLPKLQELTVSRRGSQGPGVTDAGMDAIASIKNLRKLNVVWLPITNAAFGHLKPLQCLEELQILYTNSISDPAIKDVAALRNLQMLDISGTAVKGPGLVELAALKKLHTLSLHRPASIVRALLLYVKWPPFAS